MPSPAFVGWSRCARFPCSPGRFLHSLRLCTFDAYKQQKPEKIDWNCMKRPPAGVSRNEIDLVVLLYECFAQATPGSRESKSRCRFRPICVYYSSTGLIHKRRQASVEQLTPKSFPSPPPVRFATDEIGRSTQQAFRGGRTNIAPQREEFRPSHHERAARVEGITQEGP